MGRTRKADDEIRAGVRANTSVEFAHFGRRLSVLPTDQTGTFGRCAQEQENAGELYVEHFEQIGKEIGGTTSFSSRPNHNNEQLLSFLITFRLC